MFSFILRICYGGDEGIVGSGNILGEIGFSVGEAQTPYGHDNFTMLMAGVASKTGCNFEFKEGKFILQPSMMIGYSFINTFDYTSAAGVRIKSDPLNSIQLRPNLKFVANLKNGCTEVRSVYKRSAKNGDIGAISNATVSRHV